MRSSAKSQEADLPLAVPPDIFNCVIDCSRNDKAILAQCSLVCQAWLHPARTHLFHTLDLALDNETLDIFCRFIIEHPGVALYVRHLTLDGSSFRPLHGGPLPVLSLKLLSEMMPMLSGIQILKLVFICIDSEQSIGIDAACMGASDDHRPRKDDNTQGTSLEELHILSCTSSRGVVHSVADTVVMLRIFRGIGRLVWEMRAWIHYLDPDDITHPERPLFLVQVESIKLTMNHWWQWEDATLALPRVIQPCCLTSLSVRSILSWSDACATGTLLRAVGRNLKSLTLGIYIPTTYLSGRVSEIVTGISAQGLSQLETLRCTLSMEGPLDAGSQRLSILTALISTAPPSLRTVQITLQVHDDGCPVQLAVPAANWTQLDKIMSAHAGLQAVNVVLRCIESEHPPQTTGPGPEEVVKGELRATSAKGIVTVAIEVDRQY